MRRFALYALCAAAIALAVWLVLGTRAPEGSPDRAGEPLEGAAAIPERGKVGVPALPPGESARPATDPADLLPIQPDRPDPPDSEQLQAYIDAFTRGDLGEISEADEPQPVAPEKPREVAPTPTLGGGGPSAPVAPFPPPGDPRELRPLADELPVPSEATPIEPEPEKTGNLADPDVQPSILPKGPLPAD
jgi:hypothetical protein